MKNLLIAVLLLLFVLVSSSFAEDLPKGYDIMKGADDQANNFPDMSFTMTMTLVDSAGNKGIRVLELRQKGEKRLLVFTEPPSDRGMAFLALDEYTNFVYLPAFKKIRRIAAHVRNQSFMGSDMSYEDTATTRYLKSYNAKCLGEASDLWRIELIPKPDAKVGYAKLELRIHKKDKTINEIHYFNAVGKKIKEEIRTEFKVYKDKYWQPGKVKMVNFQDNHKTILDFSNTIFAQGLTDDLFSKRNLKRPIR